MVVSTFLFFCACHPKPLSVMGNEGSIEYIYLSEVTASGDPAPRDPFNLLDTLEKLGIDVCFTRYLLCYGTDISTASICHPPQSPEDDSLPKAISEMLPLNLSGHYNNLVVDGMNFRFDSLPVSDRIDLILYLGAELDGLQWSDGQWKNGRITVSRTDGQIHFDSSAAVLANSLWSGRKHNRNNKGLADSNRTVYINWKMVCGDLPTDSCMDTVKSKLSIYVQDQYVVRSSGSTHRLYARNRPRFYNDLKRLLQSYASRICGRSVSTVELEDLAIKGGNYAIRNNLVFIGADVASYYLSCENHWRAVGFEEKPTIGQLEQALFQSFSGERDGKVIWVGDGDPDTTLWYDCAVEIPENSLAQPLYHIDLFFHPLGLETETDTFHYIIATMIDSLHPDTVVKAPRYINLKERLALTDQKLQMALRQIGLVPKPITVPFGFAHTKNNEFFIAFANGHSERLKNGTFRFLMPSYLNANSLKFGAYDSAHVMALDSLERAGVEVVPIWANYGYQSALHCTSKVLRRK